MTEKIPKSFAALNPIQQRILEKLEAKATWVSVSVLEQEVGVSRKTITHYIAELIELGRVKVKGKGTSTNPRYFTLSNYADQQVPLHPTKQKILDVLRDSPCSAGRLKEKIGKSKAATYRNLGDLMDQGLFVREEQEDDQYSIYRLSTEEDTEHSNVHPHFSILVRMLKLGTWAPVTWIKGATHHTLDELRKEGLVKQETKNRMNYYMLTVFGVLETRKMVQKVK